MNQYRLILLRILYVAHYFGTNSAASIATKEICERLSLRGHEVDVIFPTHADLKITLTNVNVFPFKLYMPYFLSLILGYFLISHKIIKMHNRNNYNLIMSQYHIFHLASFISAILSWYLKLPLVVRVHNVVYDTNIFNGLEKFFVTFTHTLNIYALKQASLITVLTTESLSYIVSNYNIAQEKMIIFPNCVDLNLFQCEERFDEKFDFIFIGSLSYEDGLELIITALKMVSKYEPNVQLLLVGSGKEEGKIVDMIDELDLTTNVHLNGPVPHVMVPSLIRNSKIGLGPFSPRHTYETFASFPMKMVEYMAMSKPVLVGKTSVTADLVVNDFNGYRLEEVPEIMSKMMLYIMEDSKKRIRLGNNGREYVKKKYDWNIMVDNLNKRLLCL